MKRQSLFCSNVTVKLQNLGAPQWLGAQRNLNRTLHKLSWPLLLKAIKLKAIKNMKTQIFTFKCEFKNSINVTKISAKYFKIMRKHQVSSASIHSHS